jgi:hypothetical protein
MIGRTCKDNRPKSRLWPGATPPSGACVPAAGCGDGGVYTAVVRRYGRGASLASCRVCAAAACTRCTSPANPRMYVHGEDGTGVKRGQPERAPGERARTRCGEKARVEMCPARERVAKGRRGRAARGAKRAGEL